MVMENLQSIQPHQLTFAKMMIGLFWPTYTDANIIWSHHVQVHSNASKMISPPQKKNNDQNEIQKFVNKFG